MRFLICSFFFFITVLLPAQNITVGTHLNHPNSNEGYTLFSPLGSRSTFLVNNCGQLLRRWNSNFSAALGAKLHSDGYLYRLGRINNPLFNVSGKGGIIEKFNWDGQLEWQFQFQTDSFTPHHNFCILPNGNIILIVAEKKSREEAILKGRDSIAFNSSYDYLVSESLVELRPIGFDSAEIVWSWRVWDHLVQDFDSSKANFGSPFLQRDKIDLNFIDHPDLKDWLHINSVAFQEARNELALSVRHLNEVWIIDHSTNTNEAAGSSGGIRGKGGDLLYRFGNPEAFRGGSQLDQKLEGQHDIEWVDSTRLSYFNNGSQRGYSSVELIKLQRDIQGNYPPSGNGSDSLQYNYSLPSTISSGRYSSFRWLDGNHKLICSGVGGHLIELDEQDSVVWYYVNPVGPTGILTQGTIPVGGSNDVFHAQRYFSSDAALSGKDLSYGIPIELNYNISHCQLQTGLTHFDFNSSFTFYPNPAADMIFLENLQADFPVQIVDFSGKKILISTSNSSRISLSVTDLPDGLYIIQHGRISKIFQKKS